MAGCRLRGRDLGPGLGYMVLNLADSIERGRHLGSTISARSEHPSAEGTSNPFLILRGILIRSNGSMQFKCCGYLDNKSFQLDPACPSVEAAAQKRGCVGPFSNYANKFLDIVFTAMFGIVGTLDYFPPLFSLLSESTPTRSTQNPTQLTSPILALDVILCLCTAMVLKRRAENERYRHIDEKNRFDRL